jgi:hypothetical protein
VLLVDDLVGDGVLQHASTRARIVHVGKRGGCKSTPQAFIEKLMIMAAREGEVVVRLKGGDPFIFGRGGEEVEHLRAEGIEVQVINGITAGLAGLTSLGAPLTHRDHAHGVVFITGHAKPGDAGTDWQQLAATARDAKLTLVIYMGVSGAAQIQAPAAPRTRPRQRRHRAQPGHPVLPGRAGIPLSGVPDHAAAAQELRRGADAAAVVLGTGDQRRAFAVQHRVRPLALAGGGRLRVHRAGLAAGRA